MMKADIGLSRVRIKESEQPLKAGRVKEKDPPLDPPERTQPG